MRREALGIRILLIAAGLGVCWFWLRAPASEPKQRVDLARGIVRSGSWAHGKVPEHRPASRASAARAERDALHARIARALAVDGATAEGSGGRGSSGQQPAQRPTAGNLRNRTGGRQALFDYLNQDFMPLAKECIEQAQERTPELRGMLWMDVEIAAAEEVGGVIDRAEPAARNEVRDAELIECIRQSALSVTIPNPLTTGREPFVLTLRVGEQLDADR